MAQIFRDDDHDTVIRKYAELVEKNNPDQYVVKTSIAEKKPNLVGKIAPDIVLYSSSGDKIMTVIEVETDASLGNDTAEKRWKPISEEAPALQILVPKGAISKTNRICKKYGIKARIQEFG